MLGKKLITAAAGNAGGEVLGIEDVFSTWLYTGNGSTQTITNGIDLAGEGGMVWIKSRSASTDHQLFDTARGTTKELISNSTAAEATDADTLTAFNADGFDLGADANINASAETYTSWSVRKSPSFFDVVTYTGTGVARTIAHNLGSVPGCIIIKSSSLAGTEWAVYHRSLGASSYIVLNTSAASTSTGLFNNTAPTASEFSVGIGGDVNSNGNSYVAYLFAHDAGGFGDGGTESVIKCGTYTGNGSTSGPIIDLGWEPQWLLIKKSSSTGNWGVFDSMRGIVSQGVDRYLWAHLASAETGGPNWVMDPLATGFQLAHNPSYSVGEYNTSGATYVYIAIRRGPMKTPTDATTVFSAVTQTTGSSTTPAYITGFPVDMAFRRATRNSTGTNTAQARLTGATRLLTTTASAQAAESNNTFDYMNGWSKEPSTTTNNLAWSFRRAPGYFDVVAYTGTGSVRTVSHNLGAVPELMIVKVRSSSGQWAVYDATNGATKTTLLNSASGAFTFTAYWNNTAPTSTQFTVATDGAVNDSGKNYIAYLFATCPGVSKVGSYTGTGATLDVDCGFTAGARFVLIKRTDSTGDWYVWDTARGIIPGNDPYLRLNLPDAENTSTDYIDPLSSGFQISSTAPTAINALGGSFIFLAIA